MTVSETTGDAAGGRRDVVRQLGDPINVRQAVESHRGEHGRGTSRWLADTYGVSQRTAQRWLAGTQQPRGDRARQVMDGADRQQIRINTLRQTQRVDIGSVRVRERSPDRQGTRRMGNRSVDLGPVADALEGGADEDEAQRLFDEAVIEAYGSGNALEILGYEDELDFQ